MEKRKPFHYRYKNEIKAYLLLLFPLFWFTLFFTVGFFRGFYYSMTNYAILMPKTMPIKFVWFENYINLFSNPLVIKAFKNSLIWTLAMLVGNNFFGMLMAILIQKIKRWRGFFLAGLFWPTLVSAVVGAEIMLMMLKGNESGLFNIIAMKWFGQENPINWIDSKYALICLMILPFFLGFCTKMMIYYAGIKSIPQNYYEAASLETDSSFRMFRYITFPLFSPVIFLNVLLSFMEGFKVLAPMQLTNAVDNADSVVYYLYRRAFQMPFRIGEASAVGFVLFVIIIIVTIIQMRFKKEAVTYE